MGLRGGRPPAARWMQRMLASYPLPARIRSWRALVWILTYLCYMSYHATRKVTSAIKTTWNPRVVFDPWGNAINPYAGWAPFNSGTAASTGESAGVHTAGQRYLGTLDTVFIFSYAVGMFISGHTAERSNLRYFIVGGMLGSAFLTALLGLAYSCHIHNFMYFVLVQFTSGFYQATGWPAVLSVMGNWFPKGRRALVMGVWNSHLNVGNILGTIIPAALLSFGWGFSFYVPALLMTAVALLLLSFLPAFPIDVDERGHFDQSPEEPVNVIELNTLSVSGVQTTSRAVSESNVDQVFAQTPTALGARDEQTVPVPSPPLTHKEMTLTQALFIPGVLWFAVCLFFVKLISYTFLNWLPYYVENTSIQGRYLSESDAAALSSLFDVGGIVGGIVLGYICDRSRMPATICCCALYASTLALFFYRAYGSVNYGLNVVLLLLSGSLIYGPYCLITTAVSADLGSHESLRGNQKAMALVSAIIDGTGSLGAALGPFLAGVLPTWTALFVFLVLSALIAASCLVRMARREVIFAYRHSGRYQRLPAVDET
eukprot:m.564470 g.564470  ORF g.564470 m.564470 type:complete len:543 (+) comp57814_c0_seq64:87-1715(+)